MTNYIIVHPLSKFNRVPWYWNPPLWGLSFCNTCQPPNLARRSGQAIHASLHAWMVNWETVNIELLRFYNLCACTKFYYLVSYTTIVALSLGLPKVLPAQHYYIHYYIQYN